MANIVRLRFATVKETQRFHPAQTVEKVAAQASERQKVAAISLRRAHADQRHKQRDQRGGAEKNQRRRPVYRENGDDNQQRDAGGEGHLREVTRVVVVHIVNLLKHQRRPASGGFPLNPRGTGLLQAIEHLAAYFIANMLPGIETYPLAQPYHPGPQNKNQHQDDKRQYQRRRRNILHNHAMKDPRQQPGLTDDQQAANDAQRAGNHQPATGENALLF